MPVLPHILSDGRAAIFDRETGRVMVCSVPTAIENVANGQGRYVHGETGDQIKTPAPTAAPAPEPVIALTEPDVLPLPAAEQPAEAPVAETAPAQSAPLDHDGDGKKGGAKPADPERKAVIAELKAKGVSYFAGASTAKLKEILAAS